MAHKCIFRAALYKPLLPFAALTPKDWHALHEHVRVYQLPDFDVAHRINSFLYCRGDGVERGKNLRGQVVYADGFRVNGDVYIVQLMPNELATVFKVYAVLQKLIVHVFAQAVKNELIACEPGTFQVACKHLASGVALPLPSRSAYLNSLPPGVFSASSFGARCA